MRILQIILLSIYFLNKILKVPNLNQQEHEVFRNSDTHETCSVFRCLYILHFENDPNSRKEISTNILRSFRTNDKCYESSR